MAFSKSRMRRRWVRPHRPRNTAASAESNICALKLGKRQGRVFSLHPDSSRQRELITMFTWETGDYWVTRLVFQRTLGIVYLVAFICALNQFVPLVGEHGLLPVG